jgi:regulator of cell morphogenesis and NO signaling
MYSPWDSPKALCNVNRSFEQIFAKYKVSAQADDALITLVPDAEFIIQILTLFEAEFQPKRLDVGRVDLGVLVDYLQRSHRYYLDVMLPELTHLLLHLQALNQGSFPLLHALPAFWRAYRMELHSHFRREDEGLFPYVKKLQHRVQHPLFAFYTVDLQNYDLNAFQEDHHDETKELVEIREIILLSNTHDELPFPYRILLNKLALFERDLKVHSRLEDEVLIPQLKAIETQLKLCLN